MNNTHQQPSSRSWEQELMEVKRGQREHFFAGKPYTSSEWANLWDELEELVESLLTSHSEAIRERVTANKKDAKEIRDLYFPRVEGEPLPNEEWADIINWKNAYNSAHDDILALLNDSDV